MERTIFASEHQLFRQSVQAFVEREVAPHYERWERAGLVERELWLKAGAAGLLSLGITEEDGGSGVDDFRYNAIISEELARRFFAGVGFAVHTDLVTPYLVHHARAAQRALALRASHRRIARGKACRRHLSSTPSAPHAGAASPTAPSPGCAR